MAGIVLSIVCSVPSAEEIRQAQRVVLSDSVYQTELPGRVAPPRNRLPERPQQRWVEPTTTPQRGGNRPVRRRNQGRPADIRGQLADDVDGNQIGRALAWTLFCVLGLVLVAALIRNMRGFTRDVRRQQAPGAPTPPTPLALTRPLTESERLAAAGDYGEAIHILLLETLSELGTRIPGSVHRSWTSREILARSPLGEDARGALGMLVRSVEASLFGHADVGPGDYDRSREAFENFVKAVRRGGRAA